MKDDLHLNRALKELQDYRNVGTIEEFKRLKEFKKAKKVVKWANGSEHCPVCDFNNTGIYYEVCVGCGQALDWSE